MKKFFTMFGLAIASVIGFNQSATAQAVQRGNFIFDPYAGFPTANLVWGSIADSSDFSTIGSPFSFGGRAEFMVADNFGVGMDVNYAIAGYSYLTQTYNNSTDTYELEEYRYTSKKLRAMLRLNYHFVQTDVLDAYVGVGAGYRNVKREVYVGGEEDLGTSYTLIPVSFRLAVGGRYYFTDNIGAMLELGTSGGSAVQFGVSVKI